MNPHICASFRFLFKILIDTLWLHAHLGSDQGRSVLRAVLMLHMCLLCRFTSCLSFYSILNELNDYAGQREVVAEEMAHKVYGELMRYGQDLKAERKHVSTQTWSDWNLLCTLWKKRDSQGLYSVVSVHLLIIKTTFPRQPVAACHKMVVAVCCPCPLYQLNVHLDVGCDVNHLSSANAINTKFNVLWKNSALFLFCAVKHQIACLVSLSDTNNAHDIFEKHKFHLTFVK